MMDIATDIAARQARARAAMRTRGLGGLVVWFSGQHFMLRMNQLMYLTDFKALGPAALLFRLDAPATLIVSPEWDLSRARESVGVGEALACAQHELAGVVGALARELPGPVGLAGYDSMTIVYARAFMAAIGARPASADDLIPSLAGARTPVELERVEKAAAIADAGFAALCATARVGMREYELAAEVEAAMQALGSDDNYGLIGAGAHNLAIRAPTDRRLEAGDVVIGEITPCYRGYFAQLCRTLVLGEASPTQSEKYELLIRAQAAGLAAAAPGRASSDIAHAVNGVIGAAGYGEYCRQPYMRTRGHGLGFGGVVPNDVTEESSPVLEVGMTMIIHPNQYIPETGYMMLGDTVAIEAQGPRSLTKTPRRLFAKAA